MAIFSLTNNNFGDSGAEISGNNVVWSGYDGNDNEIYLYNYHNGSVVQLTDNDTYDSSPQISGNNVVWSGYDGNDNEIYLFDGSNIVQLTDNDTNDSNPLISGNNVAWINYLDYGRYGPSESEIYLYDGNNTIQLTDTDSYQSSLQISGNNVVWSGFDGKDSEIYLYDGNNVTKLTTNATSDYSPQVSGDNVVWTSYDGNDNEIYLYDGSQTIQLTDNTTSDSGPLISGDNVVWTSYDGNDNEIYLYDGSQTIQLTDNTTYDSLSEISGNNVVWASGYGDDREIYLYDGNQTIQLTNNDTGDYNPQISGDNVVWSGYDGNDSEIYLNFEPFLIPGEIQGRKWHDLNGNGQQDPGEPGLEGWTIYLDQNQNSQLDGDEISTTTDVNGFYSFTNLRFGTYTVAEIVDSKWQQTNPLVIEYQWTDSSQLNGPSFDWVDISAVGTEVHLGDDDGVDVTLPFDFAFYGESQNNVKISSNGYLTFGDDGANYYNNSIPNSYGLNNFIATFWDDLNPGAGGSIYYYNDVAENRFIVQYQDVPRYEEVGSLTFQTILNADGSIVFQYDELNAILDNATIGLENAAGTSGVEIAYNENYVNNGLAINFVPVQNPFSYEAHEVVVGTGEIAGDVDFGNRLRGIRVEAEDYTDYFDTTSGNSGGVYRDDDVDIEVTTDIGGGYNVGWINQGDWLSYDLNVPENSSYQLVARVASDLDRDHSLDITLDGQTHTVNFNNTGGWQSWNDVIIGNFDVQAGSQELRLDMGSSGFNLNYIDLLPSTAIRVEAEDYTNYSDLTTGNSGGVYRDDDVDIEVTTDVGGGFNVGWIDEGEWLVYDVDIPQGGLYALVARVASDVDVNHSLDISLDGETTSLGFSGTGGWQSWEDVTNGGLNLAAGSYEMRLDMGSSLFNINYIDVVPYVGDL
ncbi:periplasmic component of the Tol biopolymer transport system [Xenococcus sp. PCC 7305]|uniref:carbohydrate-binding protein n=1 Tax=Xenococcus sp. PCC 7305 TaxID=102125 RepID=UPI0002AC5C0E|nr:carbohydrate-binding protein [Xenococcus sp. PCC 7305]ELS01928.1 periplasmic component of the Tol biopolymer transport system [Xenococcus sp. PCC 7305]